ncbi:MAG: HAD family hydrolase [Pararhodobacter sp.]
MTMMPPLKDPRALAAILFDKDGTLFDFQSTWSRWAETLLMRLAEGDRKRRSAIAQAIGFDEAAARFLPASLAIAGTGREVAELIVPHLPAERRDLVALESLIAREAETVVPVPAVPLRPLLGRLVASGYRLGVATNDYETVAHRHLSEEIDLFSFVAGFDSGHGAKPDPGMLLAFAARMGVAPAQVLMVGDSAHDLIAGRAAGMQTLAVLTGVATATDLAPLADAVRPDIGHLPALLGLAPA